VDVPASKPIIGVLVLTYNHEKFIRQALESILAQECNYTIHITIHDDCSTDSNQEVIQDVMANSSHSWELVVPQNNRFSQGMSFVPELMRNVDADFVAILEGDDYWTDSAKLQLQADALTANPGASICHHTFSVYEADELVYEWPPQKWKSKISGIALAEENFIGTLTTMFRKSDIPKDFGPGFNGLSIADYPIWSLIANGKDIEFVDRNMATYRIHESNYWAHGTIEEKAFQSLRAKIYIASMVQVSNASHWIDSIAKQLKAAVEFDLAESRQELARSTDLNVRLGIESEDLKHRIEGLDRELQIRSNAIEAIYDSFSWRVTHPIRRIAKLLKNLRNR
jgi:glycosyltransferase involved in cell wall biosynthesis